MRKIPGKIAGLSNRGMARRTELTNWDLCSYIGPWSLYILKRLNSLNVQHPRHASLTKGKQKAPKIRVVSDPKKYDYIPPPSEIGTAL